MERKVSRRQFLRLAGGAAGAVALAACAPAAAPAGGGETSMSEEPIVIRYAGLDGMGARVEAFMIPWVEDNGYKLERGAFGQQELTDKIMQSVATDTYLADIFQFPSNARADVINANALQEIPQEVLEAIDFDDVLPGIVNTLSWEGKIYALPYDGDIHYYSFRKDLFADPDINSRFSDAYGYDLSPENGAETWDQWRNICEFFTGWDWNGNGEDDDFGAACMTKRGDTLWWGFNSRATAYAKHPDDAAYFIDLDTGEARLNNPGFVRALTEWAEEMQNWAPPGGTNFTYGDSLNAMNGGRVAQTYNWDAVTSATAPETSVIQGLQGYDILPGSHEVFNSKSGEWDYFDVPSHAPFHAFGGWVIAVSAQVDELAYDAVWGFVTHLTKPESGLAFVTDLTGASPYRFSQMEAVEEFATGPLQLGEEVAVDYLNAARETLDHPNAVTDQAFGGWVQYRDALELGVSKALANEASPQDALDEVAAAFNEISERMGGLQHQAELYARTLGM
ncbi:MAG: extracellular solute-binding protein [Caldilineaceae bacterium]|nr:extracellular solute-binding protein [Caldilineaceae bacterium]